MITEGVEGFGGAELSGASLGVQLQDVFKPGDPLDVQGQVYIYKEVDGRWTLDTTLNNGIVAPGNHFGYDLSMDGDLLAVSQPWLDHLGAVYLFRRIDGRWELEDTVMGFADAVPGTSQFGKAIQAQDDRIIVGALGYSIEEAEFSGRAYIFHNRGHKWVLEGTLIDPDPQEGDIFGVDVALGSDVALVGASGNSGPFNLSGAAFIYRLIDGQWQFEAELHAPDSDENEEFGHAVMLDTGGTIAVIGAYQDDDQNGSAYVFVHERGRWEFRQKLTGSNPVGTAPNFGIVMDMSDDGNTFLIAAGSDSENGSQDGAMYVFHRQGDLWVETAKLTDQNDVPGECFGDPSLSGDRAAIGAPCEIGEVYIYAGFENIDCNTNREPDACDIFAGTSLDQNGDGIPDECPAPILGDLDGDSIVNGADLGLLLLAWGKCPKDVFCQPDFNLDGMVDGADLGMLLLNWTA
jgi:hypothetical protein